MPEPLIVVYIAINKFNGKRYIGVTTKGIKNRKRNHKTSAKAGETSLFYRAVRKYGIDAFEFSILEEAPDQETVLRRERELIAELKPEYNTASGGCSGPQGWKHTEESRRKLRESHLGKVGPWRGEKRSPESIAKRTATRALNPCRYWLGKKRPPETVAKIMDTKSKRPKPKLSPEGAARISAARIKTNKRRSRQIKCLYDGRVFLNCGMASYYYGISQSPIRRCCDGEKKDTYGLSFEYLVQ